MKRLLLFVTLIALVLVSAVPALAQVAAPVKSCEAQPLFVTAATTLHQVNTTYNNAYNKFRATGNSTTADDLATFRAEVEIEIPEYIVVRWALEAAKVPAACESTREYYIKYVDGLSDVNVSILLLLTGSQDMQFFNAVMGKPLPVLPAASGDKPAPLPTRTPEAPIGSVN